MVVQKKTSSHRIPEQFSVQLQLCFMFIVVSVAHEASNLLEQPQVKTPIKLVCMHPSILLLLHSLGQLQVTVKRCRYDNAQRHVTAFRPISEAAHNWSYDNVTCSILHPSGVVKSSTSFGCSKGGNVTSAGWQVTLCETIWHVSSHNGVAMLNANR